MKFITDERGWKKELFQYALILVFGGLFQEVVIEYLLYSDPINIKNALMTGTFWLVMWKGSEYMVVLMDKTGIQWNEKPLLRFVLTLLLTLLYIVFAVTILDILIYVIILGQFSLMELLSSLGWRNFNFSIYITLGLGTFMHGRAFLLEWRQAAIEVEKFKNESLKSQYESLKNQVNPHFLFNSLNVLSSLVFDDQEKAVKFIRKLSQVYRYVLDKKDEELVDIDEELDFLENFVFLQKIRFGDNLKVEIEKNYIHAMIPPLGLQLLIENAIKHNIVSDSKPLYIRVSINENEYTIENNIQEKLSKDSTGIGLNNLKARYEFLVKKEVIITNDNETFKVVLPAIDADMKKKK